MNEKKTKAERNRLLKEKRNNLLEEYKNPEFDTGKRITFYTMIAVAAFKIFHVLLQVIYLLVNNIPLIASGVFIFMLTTFATFYFTLLIIIGSKTFVYVSLIGGFFSIAHANTNQMFLHFNADDGFFNLVQVVFHFVILIQIAAAVYLLIDKRCNVYFKSMSEIQKELGAFLKNK